MRLGKELIDKPIISMTDGKFLGKVKDLLVDPNLERLEGLFLGKEGLLRRKVRFLRREDVYVFGIDAILAKNSDSVSDSSADATVKSWVQGSKLDGRALDTPGGTKVGKVGDIIVNEDAGIIGFQLSKIAVEGPIAERGNISRSACIDVGHDDGAMTINMNVAEHAPLGLAGAIDLTEVASDTPVADEIPNPNPPVIEEEE